MSSPFSADSAQILPRFCPDSAQILDRALARETFFSAALFRRVFRLLVTVVGRSAVDAGLIPGRDGDGDGDGNREGQGGAKGEEEEKGEGGEEGE